MKRYGVVTGLAVLAALAGLVGVGWSAQKEGQLSGLDKSFIIRVYEKVVKKAGLETTDLDNYSIGQSHIDLAWRWRVSQTHDKCIKTFSNAVRHMEMYPDFTFSQSTPQYYEWVSEDDPALFAKIKQYEKEGRWEIVGGQWVEPDNNMPDGESFVRQRLYGQRYFQEHFGHMPEISWLLDSFGYQWNLPQILAKSGAKYFWTNKLTWNDTTVFPFHFFWWQAPDGSRVLAYFVKQSHYPINFPASEVNKYYHTRYLMPEGAEPVVGDYSSDYDQLAAATSGDWLNVVGIFYGKGDGGHGPTNKEILAQKHLQENGYTKLRPARELYAALEPYADRAPVWNDELYLEYHRGVLTTHGWLKRANRESEQLMRSAEVMQSVASRLGLSYAYDKLKKIWKLVLLNQFHDILPGSSIPEVYADSKLDYEKISDVAKKATQDAIAHLAAKVDTRGKSASWKPVLVFNTLSWNRSGVVELQKTGKGIWQVADSDGNEVPSQYGRCRDLAEECLFFSAQNVPSMGYQVYNLTPAYGDNSMNGGPVVSKTDSAVNIANGLVSISVDKRTGWLTSVKDTSIGKEYIAGYANQLMAWHDHAINYPAWNIQKKYLELAKNMPDAGEVRVSGQGPLFAEITIKRRFSRSDIVQIVRVFRGDPRVHLITNFDFHDTDTLVKAGFDTTIRTDKIAAEISYAVIERPTVPGTDSEKAQWEASCHRWIDLSDGTHGLALLNDGKYGYSLNEDGTGFRLTMLKAAQYPESAAEAVDVVNENLPYSLRSLTTLGRQTDQGRHTVYTALLPHTGDWREARLWQAGYEFNTPLAARLTDQHRGDLPPARSFVSLDNADVYLGAMKRAEDDGDLVLRLVEATGKRSRVKVFVKGIGNIGSVVETDLLELNPVPVVKSGANSFELQMSPHEIKTVKLSFK